MQQKRATIRKLDDGNGKLSAVRAYPVLIDTQLLWCRSHSNLCTDYFRIDPDHASTSVGLLPGYVIARQYRNRELLPALPWHWIVLEQELLNDACRLAATELASKYHKRRSNGVLIVQNFV